MLEKETQELRRKNISISMSADALKIGEKVPQTSAVVNTQQATGIENRARDKAAQIFQTNPRYVSDAKKLQAETSAPTGQPLVTNVASTSNNTGLGGMVKSA